jgi:hypothetical protein
MRELFNLGNGHGSNQSLEDMAKMIRKIKSEKADQPAKMGLHQFGYLFSDLANDPAARLPESPDTIAALRQLGTAMADPQPQTGPESGIPAGYTYLGQFIDHDITRDAIAGGVTDRITEDDFNPILADEAANLVKNIRTATLELDSVYGGGPTQDPDLYESNGVHLKLGSNRDDGFGNPDHINNNTNNRDLQREADGKPVIGDNRNDENLLVAQTHHAFVVFHNKIADSIAAEHTNPANHFAAARKKAVQHYQWIVLNDFLPHIVSNSARDKALNEPRFYTDDLSTFMPFEFSVAAYRFGHSMIRQRYDHNSIFGTAITDFEKLFAFTHGGREEMPVPQSWIINWQNFYQFGNSAPSNIARPIDTRLSGELERLPNEQGLMAMLASRNLLRGYLMSLPTGQAVAQATGATPLSATELTSNTTQQERTALQSSSLSGRTPLWYYILKESATRESGQRLGEVGSTIVAETLVALVRRSEHSILNESAWQPDLGQTNGVFTMADLLRFCDFEEARDIQLTQRRRTTTRRTRETETANS